MKAVILLGDGMGDRPVPALKGRTPLEVARKPNMDEVAIMGECGLLDPVAPGVRVGSDTAHLAILGYDPYTSYTGRGPFEAAGAGLEVRGGDVAFRCNFATVNEDMIVIDRRAGRIEEGTDLLAAALSGMEIMGARILFKESVAHRAVLVVRGIGLGHNVTDVDPHAENVRIHEAHGLDDESRRTAQIVNEFVRRSYEILRDHPVNKERERKGLPPANIVLPRGAGIAPKLQSFQEKHGLKGACIVEVDLVKGVGMYLGMTTPTVPGATGGYDTDIDAIAKAVVDALSDHDFVLCNVKGMDVAGHDGKHEEKIMMIEKMDSLVGAILGLGMDDLIIVLSADHSTPVTFKDHTGDPVPIAIAGPGVRTDSVRRFDERSVVCGGLMRIRGMDLMRIVTNLLGVQGKFGA
jgi:2,3-bisphosphoglycerate-independent phosphoglycerate mutase